jgi:hypothetical protein
LKASLSFALALFTLFLITRPAAATVRFVKWDKPHTGNSGNVTALDLANRRILWEAKPGKSINFVEGHSGRCPSWR